MNRFSKFLGIFVAGLVWSTAAIAQDVTLRAHHFMSEKSTLHVKFLEVLAERLNEASDGRLQMDVFAAMSLGGRPADLYDQAVDGAVDIILTLPGYTAGRFPQAEVFELPFLMEDNVATSRAFWDLVETRLQESDFEETHVLAAWVHGRGVIHSKEPITRLEDLRGRELRGPTRLVTDLLGELGATPVGMPLPAIPENLSKGVISGAVVPWEIVPSIRLQELVEHHTELSGPTALYTATLLLTMNIEAYEDLPDDLRAILDAETGKTLSEFAGQIMADADKTNRSLGEANTIVVLDEAEVARWESAAAPVYDRWILMASEEGFDGQALIDEARSLIDQNQ
ncbi:MAG: TRAP transporter substrate-binding protein [Pseudomonadota bacterium]